MKTRRTVSAEILLSEEYQKLSMSAQSLYVFSLMNANDYGFIKEAYKFVCKNGYKIDDLRPLTNAGFVIVFPSDDMLIADWFIHTGTTIEFDPEHTAAYDYVTLNMEKARFEATEKLKFRKSSKKNIFIPPTLEEVKEYAKSRNSSVNPVEFFNFYNTPNENGDTWIDSNGKPVENWKGKFVRVWEAKRGNNARHNSTPDPKRSKYNLSYSVNGSAEG